MMDKLIGNFTQQLRESIEIGRSMRLSPRRKDIRNVVVTGMGGSGISGNVVSELVSNKMQIPLVVCKDYFLPAWVNEHTLLIAVSYSGNTEETLHALQEGIQRSCKIVCISSGGSMKTIAEKAALDYVNIPGGNPPRASLGYSFVQQLFVLSHLNLIDEGFVIGIEDGIRVLDQEEKKIQKAAKALAKKLNNKLTVIYAPAAMHAIALRWRQQLNENSKTLAWCADLPEMNHNELAGWRKPGKFAVIFLRNESDYNRIQQRANIAKNVISQYTSHIFDVWSKGESFIERALYLIHFGDWVSYFLAEYRKVDPVEVNVIDYLKAELAN